MRTSVIADTDTNWVKEAVSVSSLNLTERLKNDLTPRTVPSSRKNSCSCKNNCEILVEIPRVFTNEPHYNGINDDHTSGRTESITPRLSDIRSPRLTPTLLLNFSPRSKCSWTEVEADSVTKSPIRVTGSPILPERDDNLERNCSGRSDDMDKSIQNINIAKISVSVKSQDKEMKNGRKYKSVGTENFHDTSGGACAFPKMRKDMYGSKTKGSTLTNPLPKLDNGMNDGSVSVRQQYYDKWARAKRGRPSLQIDSQSSTRRRLQSDDFCKNVSKNRKMKFTKIPNYNKVEDTINVAELYEIKDGGLNQLSTIDNEISEPREFSNNFADDSGVTERPGLDNRRETITAIINDIKDSLKSLNFANKSRRPVSQAMQEPFAFNKKMVNDTLKSNLYMNRDVQNRNGDLESSIISPRTLLGDDNNETFQWNRYHGFRFPVKLNAQTKVIGNKPKSDIIEKENRTIKIPMVLSKRTPLFTDHDKISVDFPARRVEEHLFKLKNRTANQLSVNSRERGCRSANSMNSQTPRGMIPNESNSLVKCGKPEHTPLILSPLPFMNGRTSDVTIPSSARSRSVKFRGNANGVQRTPRQDWPLDSPDNIQALSLKGESAVNISSNN